VALKGTDISGVLTRAHGSSRPLARMGRTSPLTSLFHRTSACRIIGSALWRMAVASLAWDCARQRSSLNHVRCGAASRSLWPPRPGSSGPGQSLGRPARGLVVAARTGGFSRLVRPCTATLPDHSTSKQCNLVLLC